MSGTLVLWIVRILPPLLVAGTLVACSPTQLATVRAAGAAAIEAKRQLDDMKARAIMAATCDISLGAYFRELSDIERQYAALVCGGQFPRTIPTPIETSPAR